MKRILLVNILLLVTLICFAYEKADLKMQKGLKKVYVTETITDAPYAPYYATTRITVESLYEVTESTPDGYILDVRNTNVTTDMWTNKKENNYIGNPVFSYETALEEGARYIFATDKAGKILKLLNFDEVKEKRKVALHKFFSAGMVEIITDTSETYQAEIEDSMVNKILDEMTEESVLKKFLFTISPLGLNGKNIVDGTEEEYEVKRGIRMKRTYQVKSNGGIKSSSSLNMTPEEVKQYYMKPYKDAFSRLKDEDYPDLTEEEFHKLATEKLSNFKPEDPVCITLIPAFKLKASEKAAITFLPDGWVKTVNSTSSIDEYGENTKTTYKIYCK